MGKSAAILGQALFAVFVCTLSTFSVSAGSDSSPMRPISGPTATAVLLCATVKKNFRSSRASRRRSRDRSVVVVLALHYRTHGSFAGLDGPQWKDE